MMKLTPQVEETTGYRTLLIRNLPIDYLRRYDFLTWSDNERTAEIVQNPSLGQSLKKNEAAKPHKRGHGHSSGNKNLVKT